MSPSSPISVQLGRVEATGGFLLLTAWLNYADTQGLIPLALAACALHEGGHLLALHAMGAEVTGMRLSVTGAEIRVTGTMSYPQELLSALAGPGCNLLLAALFCRLPGGSLFAGLNLALALLNLLPIGALDGGRVLRAALNWLVSPQAGDRVCPPLERALAGCLLSFGAFLAGAGGSVTLLITAIWLFSSLSWEKEGKRGCHMGRKRVK